MTIYCLASYSNGSDRDTVPVILTNEAYYFYIYDATGFSLLQAFDPKTARISASKHYVQVQKVDQSLFLLFHQDLGYLLRFVHDGYRVAYSALVNGEKCYFCFEGNSLCLLTFKRNIDLQRGDCLSVSGGTMIIYRGSQAIYICFQQPEVLYECGRIGSLILRRMSGAKDENKCAAECTSYFCLDPRQGAQGASYFGAQQQLSVEVCTTKNKLVRAVCFRDAGGIIVMLRKGLYKRQFVLEGVNEIAKTPLHAQFYLLPEREVLIAVLPVYERICSFCASMQQNTVYHAEPDAAKPAKQVATWIYAPTPTSEEIERALKLLSLVVLNDAQGKHVQVKFSFPENVAYATIGGQQTICFSGTRIHAEHETAIVFYFVGCDSLFTARRTLYLQISDALTLLYTARYRGINFSAQTAQRQNFYQVYYQINQARQKTLSYYQVLRQLSVAMYVYTTEEKQHYCLQFSTDGERVFVSASYDNKAIMEPTQVQDVALIDMGQQKATFKVLPIPNVLVAATQEFYGFWTAWREFKDGQAQY